MKKIIFILLSFLTLSLGAQNRVKIEKKTIAGGFRNAITIKIPYFEKSVIKNMWKEKMKAFGGKSSLSNLLNETLVIREIHNNKITPQAYTTYTKVEDPITDTLTIVTAVQFLNGSFLNDQSIHGYKVIEKQLLDFTFDVSKNIYNATLINSQKELDKASKIRMKHEIENSKLLTSNEKQLSIISISNIKRSKYDIKIDNDSLELTKDNLSLKKQAKIRNRLIKNNKKIKKYDFKMLKSREKTIRNNNKIEANNADIKVLDEKIMHYEYEIEKFKNQLNYLKR